MWSQQECVHTLQFFYKLLQSVCLLGERSVNQCHCQSPSAALATIKRLHICTAGHYVQAVVYDNAMLAAEVAVPLSTDNVNADNTLLNLISEATKRKFQTEDVVSW